jgi:hypothetical protein
VGISINKEIVMALKERRETTNVSYLYNSLNEITAVQLPYEDYLKLVSEKRGSALEGTVSSSEMGMDILRASLKDLQKEGWTLSKIADHLGVKQPYLSKILRENRLLKPNTLEKYFSKLGEISGNAD